MEPGRFPTRIGFPEYRTGYLIEHPEPSYPPEAIARGIEGTVLLDIVVGHAGVVESVLVREGDAILAEAAAQAIRAWRYRPCALNGRPVEVKSEVRVNFKLPGEVVSD
jgi:protein TonB